MTSYNQQWSADQPVSKNKSSLTTISKHLNKNFHFTAVSDIFIQVHINAFRAHATTHPSEKLRSGCCLNRCLVCLEQHTRSSVFIGAPNPLDFHRGTAALVTTTTPDLAHRNTSQVFEVRRQRVKEQRSGQRWEASGLLPDLRGREWCCINNTEHGHQGLVHYPSGNVWPWMTQPPTRHKRTGETLLCPKQFPDYPK